ncbi:MAG: PD-(D/E)XK nuclease family protein [Fermentimonas sp.]|nr:PD-(D/E)XK nuclease family protein [Fermentimonas sp.]
MTPFLYQVAQLFYSKYGSKLHEHTFVFPNRRAAMFFRKYLAEITDKPLFSPAVLTIQELFASLTTYRQADRIEMLVTLYKHFKRISGSEESFDDFIFWGEMLLNDFDDVDKYLVDAEQLFVNVHDFRLLDDDLTHLDESQIEAMRRFWDNFMPVEGNNTKEKFHETWKILLDLYTSLRDELHKNSIAYEGMIFREVAEKALNDEIEFMNDRSFIFVGFNLLSPSEATLFNYLKRKGFADFYWDYDSPLVHDDNNRASFRVKDNLRQFPSKHQLEITEVEVKSKIELIGVPSGVGQAKHISNIITDLIDKGEIKNPDEAINTAIVLPDENLLIPVLYSIPKEIGKINVTMGYSLSHSSIAGLVEHISLLQQNQRKWNNEVAFYHRYVKAILNHPLIILSANQKANELKEHILKYNRVVVPVSEITEDPLLKLIFTPISEWSEISSYLHIILSFLYNALTEIKHSDDDLEEEYLEEDKINYSTNHKHDGLGDLNDKDKSIVNNSHETLKDKNSINHSDLEREFIVQYYKTITSLGDRLNGVDVMSVDTYFRLLRKLARGISVPFSGEPLSGLQIMGVLETRTLDFDNLIILSMNEGVFPIKKATTSFIPFTLRKGFALPTYEFQDSTYAYHFYRMISRAKNIYLLYDTRTEGMQTGEVSRYFYQLKYLYNSLFDISEKVVTYDVSAPSITPVSVEKTPEVMNLLSKFRAGGEKSLSASHINNYIDCPLKFYFTALENLSEETDVQESVESDVFGTIFHRLMEVIYKRFYNIDVTPNALTAIINNDAYLNEVLEIAFSKYFFKDEGKPRKLQGQYYLIGEILKSYVKQTLKVDIKSTPFRYIGSEYRFNTPYKVNEQLAVNFKGSIDRIDNVGDSVRIIDYKTGTGETKFKDIQQLFDSTKDKRPYQILQVFVYGLFYLNQNPGVKLSPAVYYLRSIFNDFDLKIIMDKVPVNDLNFCLPEFKEKFDEVIEEIFNPSVPFTQTQNSKNCQWCTFKDLCNK